MIKMIKMIKNFECYSKRQSFSNGFTQWEKQYDDGQTAWVCVDDKKVTRSLVRSAFKAQESGIEFGHVFTKDDADHYGFDC